MKQKLIAFIGAGNMSRAIILGLLNSSYPADKIIAANPSNAKLEPLAQLGVKTTNDNRFAAEAADVVVLAVKPQLMATACADLIDLDFSDKLVISIAAGISVQRLHQLLPGAVAGVAEYPIFAVDRYGGAVRQPKVRFGTAHFCRRINAVGRRNLLG